MFLAKTIVILNFAAIHRIGNSDLKTGRHMDRGNHVFEINLQNPPKAPK